jgi:hypothetical protein
LDPYAGKGVSAAVESGVRRVSVKPNRARIGRDGRRACTLRLCERIGSRVYQRTHRTSLSRATARQQLRRLSGVLDTGRALCDVSPTLTPQGLRPPLQRIKENDMTTKTITLNAKQARALAYWVHTFALEHNLDADFAKPENAQYFDLYNSIFEANDELNRRIKVMA